MGFCFLIIEFWEFLIWILDTNPLLAVGSVISFPNMQWVFGCCCSGVSFFHSFNCLLQNRGSSFWWGPVYPFFLSHGSCPLVQKHLKYLLPNATKILWFLLKFLCLSILCLHRWLAWSQFLCGAVSMDWGWFFTHGYWIVPAPSTERCSCLRGSAFAPLPNTHWACTRSGRV